jgi:hypothetical protein
MTSDRVLTVPYLIASLRNRPGIISNRLITSTALIFPSATNGSVLASRRLLTFTALN